MENLTKEKIIRSAYFLIAGALLPLLAIFVYEKIELIHIVKTEVI
jgi:hypothetical protein